MDLFLFACVKAGLIPGYAVEKNVYAALMHAANFKNPNGSPVIEFIEISREEYEFKKNHRDENGCKDMEDEVIIKDGKYIRSKTIQEVSGYEIRESIERKYGKDVIIVLIGGPPCQEWIKMNKRKKRDEDGLCKNSRHLIFEYLRILTELNPDVGLMEQTSEIESPQFEDIFKEFIEKAKQLPFKLAYQDMNSIHYGGNQSRIRRVFMFVNNFLNAQPVFPTPVPEKAKRVRDFLDIDHFFSGHFTDKIKTKNDFMCAVTSGSPQWFYKNGKKRHPTVEELLLCMDVRISEYVIPPDVPVHQVKKAIGNGVCVSMGHALAVTVVEKVLRLKTDCDGYWIPIDGTTDEAISNESSEVTPASSDGNDMLTIPEQKLEESASHEGRTKPSLTTPLLSAIPIETNSLSSPKVEKESQQSNVLDYVQDKIESDNHSLSSPKTTVSDEPIKSKLPELRNVSLNYVRSQKIISSEELRNMQFKSLNFEDEWNTFFGLPSFNFYCIIYGLSGEGKSTFAIQLAHYLANNFGRVLYISGEEGFSMTFRDKFVNSNATSDFLDVADLRSFNEIMQEVRTDTYNFIFIDSLDSMKIDAGEMKIIRATYMNSAIISISQSTKAGEMRGSYQIMHDSDIAVTIENGIATTTKNRFKEKGMSFEVFSKMQSEN